MPLKNSKKSGQWSILIILALLVVSGVSWWSSNLHSTPARAASIVDQVKVDPQPPAARPPQQAEDACYCSSDIYNCNNFQYQQEAQSCYDDCQAQGRGDIHELDSNSNGLACEELPLEPTPVTSQATPYTDPALRDPVFRSLANADNLLTNGNFEADFYGAPELGFEPPETGWIPNSWGWFKSQAYGKYNIYGNEGFALVCPDDFRLFTNSALSLSFHIQSSDQPDARLGIYQTVSVTPGQQYLFAMQGAIQSQPGAGSPDINNRLEVFFDQGGGTDWQATPHEKWTSLPWREQELEFETSGPQDPDLARIQEYYTIIKPSSNRLTVFLNAWRRWPNWRTTIFTVDCVSLTPLNQVDVAALAPRLTQLSTTAVDAALKGSGGVAAPASVSGQPAAAPVTGAVIAPAAGGIVDTKSNWLLITAVSLLVILGLVGAGVWNARRQKE
ncbi:MAG: hypothetical protein DPW09_01670 [Anaerolineae bacterium]|nr:hypothetical protein [Anaerolineales bacterium]MCQ3972135.1 hypothetical protein [Anaerolineae bacterium]